MNSTYFQEGTMSAERKSPTLLFNLFFFGALICLPLVFPHLGFATVSPNSAPVFSLNVKDETLKEALEKISKLTNYEIQAPAIAKEIMVTVEMHDVTLEQGLEMVLDKVNHCIVYGDGNKISIGIYELGSVNASESQGKITRKQLKGLHERQEREIESSMKDMDEIVLAASKEGSALTRKQLKALHERQQREIEAESQDMDQVVIPGSGDKPKK